MWASPISNGSAKVEVRSDDEITLVLFQVLARACARERAQLISLRQASPLGLAKQLCLHHEGASAPVLRVWSIAP